MTKTHRKTGKYKENPAVAQIRKDAVTHEGKIGSRTESYLLFNKIVSTGHFDELSIYCENKGQKNDCNCTNSLRNISYFSQPSAQEYHISLSISLMKLKIKVR